MKENPLWYKDAVFYEVRIKSFADSNGDGIGDIPGLTSKLDYLQDLGVTVLWLLPFYPSPMKDDGYDISDYTDVDPDSGTLHDFRTFLREAHERGLRVVTELVLNHTSEKHPWFLKARRDKPGGRWRNMYVWSDKDTHFAQTRIIFKDFENSNWAWDPVANAYYWHRFYSHQPDLNYDNPAVRKTMLQVVDFWLEMGVDGLRLDAVPYLFEREGTSCENLPETHAFLKELRRHVDKKFTGRMLLSEANQWPEDAAAYFGQGDETHVAFHFPLMPRMFMSLHMEDRFPLVDILNQTPAIPATCQWATFLRNHDELTLEMVTEEERDYMYRVYAKDPKARINLGIRRRLAPLLGNDRKKIELMNGLLFSLPGTPVLYYGDEIGMGDNIFLGDRNGVRTPMQWSADRNAGFSRANPQRLLLPVTIDPEYHYETINVEAQQSNPSSILWWMKRLIALRKQSKAMSQGTVEFLTPKNHHVLAFLRTHEETTVLVIANLSRFAQYIELDLSKFKGRVPLEMFGRTEFPPIGELPYFLTLGPHAFYWFSIDTPRDPTALPPGEVKLPELSVEGGWNQLLHPQQRGTLEKVLPAILRTRRWFDASRTIKQARIVEVVPLTSTAQAAVLTLVQVDYNDGDMSLYSLPLSFRAQEEATAAGFHQAPAALARLSVEAKGEMLTGILYDAFYDPLLAQSLLHALIERRRFKGVLGALKMKPLPELDTVNLAEAEKAVTFSSGAEEDNTSLVFGDQLILKLLRKLEPGVHPEVEMELFLREKGNFLEIPTVAGVIEYQPAKGDPITAAILHRFTPNQGTGWDLTITAVQRFFEAALARGNPPPELAAANRPLTTLMQEPIPALAHDLIGAHLTGASLLGQRTAQMHAALAKDLDDPDFKPEAFTSHYQWSLYQSMRSKAAKTLAALRERLSTLSPNAKAEAQRVLELDAKIQKSFRLIADTKLNAMRTRCHGDYDLTHILYTGKDFLIIDFEGDPTLPLSERRIKRSPFHDAADMLCSFHEAARLAMSRQTAGPVARPQDAPSIAPWAIFWQQWVGAAFLKSYIEGLRSTRLLPVSVEHQNMLLTAYRAENFLKVLACDLAANRTTALRTPLQGLLQLFDVAV